MSFNRSHANKLYEKLEKLRQAYATLNGSPALHNVIAVNMVAHTILRCLHIHLLLCGCFIVAFKMFLEMPRGLSNIPQHVEYMESLATHFCLNYGVQCLIVHHLCAMTIQRRFRRHLLAHTYQPAWSLLRRMLATSLSRQNVDILNACELVRREWRREPVSWIEEMKVNSAAANVIATEVQNGWWDQRFVFSADACLRMRANM